MKDKPRIAFFDVEAVAIVGDDNIRFIIKLPQFYDERFIVLPIFAESGIVWERTSADFSITVPLIRKRENIPAMHYIN